MDKKPKEVSEAPSQSIESLEAMKAVPGTPDAVKERIDERIKLLKGDKLIKK